MRYWKEFQSHPKISRGSFTICQSIGSSEEERDREKGPREARNLTDTKFINNIKLKEKMSRRTHDHCFEAVSILKKKYENQDKYLVYELVDGSEAIESFVFKISNWINIKKL